MCYVLVFSHQLRKELNAYNMMIFLNQNKSSFTKIYGKTVIWSDDFDPFTINVNGKTNYLNYMTCTFLVRGYDEATGWDKLRPEKNATFSNKSSNLNKNIAQFLLFV